ncbi:MAG: HNH endonuclease [Anaerolineae bacterium]|nr:HNH endonuclease [Anaerolineae bacterium]
MPSQLPDNTIQKFLESIKSKRARIIIQHISEHGYITTEELEKTYGYAHPPRAARDVRESGIPLETFRVKSSEGRSIAAYRFGDLSKIRKGRLQGRKTFSQKLKIELYELSRGRCAICSGYFQSRYLQIDHRVPYEIAGDDNEKGNVAAFMLLCGSCNRAKSWSCEHCENWQKKKLQSVCLTCYWANPDNYAHIALREVRRVDVIWDKDEIQAYERLKKESLANDYPMPDYVKRIVRKHLDGNYNEGEGG